jgi:flagellar biosynthesis GTPase FlhF
MRYKQRKGSASIVLILVLLIFVGGGYGLYSYNQKRAAIRQERRERQRLEQERQTREFEEQLRREEKEAEERRLAREEEARQVRERAEERRQEQQARQQPRQQPAGAASVTGTYYRFSNGVSFSIPSGYKAEESDILAAMVSLKNMSDTMYFSMTFLVHIMANFIPAELMENPGELTVSDLFRFEKEVGALFEGSMIEFKPGQQPQVKQQRTKTTVAGKEALLTEMEISMPSMPRVNGMGVDAYQRMVHIPFGNSIVNITSMTIDKSKANACRAIAKQIENSLRF